MTTVYIAEKPEVAKAIVGALGGNFSRKDGYFESGGQIVTWCLGHLMELYEPHDYDDKYKSWDFSLLPFQHYPASRKAKSNTFTQFKTVKNLIQQATEIIHAGDPDEEGQLLVDEILRDVKNRKPVYRILINDNTTSLVKKAIHQKQPNQQYEYMGWRAEARSIADQMLGINLTRAYTNLQQRKTGSKGVVSVGRVQTAILGLVVRRDEQFESHQKSFYYNIFADIQTQNMAFRAKFLPNAEQCLVDDKNRLIDREQAVSIQQQCIDKNVSILDVNTREKTVSAPLPYNLLKLQQDCARKYNLDPSQTLSITQTLREKYKLITYNRSDSQYLSTEQFLEADDVLKVILNNIPEYRNYVGHISTSSQPRAFDSSKVTAHHAIIPQQTEIDLSVLSDVEKKVYMLIAKAYLAQFLPDYRYKHTEVICDIGGHKYKASSHIPLVQGWKTIFSSEDFEQEENDEQQDKDLSILIANESAQCINAVVKDEETKPLPRYTMATLLADLTRSAKYIKNPTLAKILKERDKDKEGEHGGIGTPATRDSIINTLFYREFIVEDKKKIISTSKGRELYNLISDEIRYPDLTAIWTDKFNSIHTEQDVASFISFVFENHIVPEVENVRQSFNALPMKSNFELTIFDCPDCGRKLELGEGKFGKFFRCSGYFDNDNPCKKTMKYAHGEPIEKTLETVSNYACPKCTRPMAKRQGKFGTFWSCTGWNAEISCNHSMDDKDGVPVEKQAKKPIELSNYQCKKCGSALIHRKGTTKAGKAYSFFGCSGFPKCKQNYDEVNGEPKYD